MSARKTTSVNKIIVEMDVMFDISFALSDVLSWSGLPVGFRQKLNVVKSKMDAEVFHKERR